MNAPGTYALLLRLDSPQRIQVGRLGEFPFPAGWYLYLGSARGPGGLAARLARHRRVSDKRFHWHIDYLRAVATPIEAWTVASDVRLECHWARAAATLPGATIVAPRFGASDCRCASHLYYFSHRVTPGEFRLLAGAVLKREWVEE